VDTVFAALKGARAGETYIPRAPSATVAGIARALVGKRKIETRIVGVRPGEKLHEILVSEEEANHCITRGGYYVIQPMLPELRVSGRSRRAFEREYSSANHVLNAKDTAALLRRHRLLPERVEVAERGELMR
jgi:UDP-glucose 4-epimerase